MSLIFDIGNYNRNQNLKNKQVKIVNGGVVLPGKSVLFSGLLHYGWFGGFFPKCEYLGDVWVANYSFP